MNNSTKIDESNDIIKLDSVINLTKLPTTTAHITRLRIYQPTRRPIMCTRTVETAWGTAAITGKVGQGHADVMEAIFTEKSKFRLLPNNMMQILVDPYRVRMAATGGEYELGYKQFNDITTDLMRTVIDMSIPNRQYSMDKGVLLVSAKESVIDAITTKGGFGKENRKMWLIEIGEHYVRLIDKDIRLYYDLRPIALLTGGFAQAIARHLLTHKNQPQDGWIIDNLIEAVGADPNNNRRIRSKRRDELEQNAQGLKDMGIIVDIRNGRIRKD